MTSWKTLLGLGAAAVAFLRLSDDLQIHDLIPKEIRAGEKPTCGYYEKAILEFDRGLNVYSWRCVPDPTIPRKPGR